MDDLDRLLGRWWSALPTWAGLLVYLALLFAIVVIMAFVAGTIRSL